MKKRFRIISSILVLVMAVGIMPTIPIISSAATLTNPFDQTVINSTSVVTSASVNLSQSELIGPNNEVALYSATATSWGSRKSGASATQTFNMKVAIGDKSAGARLFTYSMPTASGFSVAEINTIAANFESTHPGWKVAVATNASFFDNDATSSSTKTTEKGQTEEPYIEDGKTYKYYFETGKNDSDGNPNVGRGLIGTNENGELIYYTFETSSTSHYKNGSSKSYAFESNHTLSVLGTNGDPIYEYDMYQGASLDYATEIAFVTPEMGNYNFYGNYVYDITCSNYKCSNVGINGAKLPTADFGYFFEGTISSVTLASYVEGGKTVPSGHVYLSSPVTLAHLTAGTKVRGEKQMTGTWANMSSVFAFKQQILLDGEPLFYGASRESYSSTSNGASGKEWDSWTEDIYYASYGTNRTAIGFKADGSPVIITAQRNPKGTTGSDTNESGVTYNEMAWYMKSLGCVNAFMMDCGGSMGMYKKSTGSSDFTVACCEPLHTKPNRPIANVLILAYPTGVTEPTDTPLDDPALKTEYITAAKATWYSGRVPLRSKATVAAQKDGEIAANTTLSHTNFSFTQSGNTYTLTPNTTTGTSGHSIYAYKKLYDKNGNPYTMGAGKHYTYYFKAKTTKTTAYASFLFAELTGNTSTSKMLNNFAVVGGGLSNCGDANSSYSDVRLGLGRVQSAYEDTEVFLYNGTINSWLESNYSYYRLFIDGTTVMLQTRHAQGSWVNVKVLNSSNNTYTNSAFEGAQLVLGLASWFNGSGSASGRNISVKEVVLIDRTALVTKINQANALTSSKSLYTAASWANFEYALNKANYAGNLTSQSNVDFAVELLTKAINNLVKVADLNTANSYIAEYKTKNASDYTSASWATYTAAYNNLVTAVNTNSLSNLASLNSAYLTARNALVAVVISVDIGWQEMNFVYDAGGGEWDPEKHEYVGSTAATGWSSPDNSNIITVTNSSNISIGVDFGFTPEAAFSALVGEFYNNEQLLSDTLGVSVGASAEVTFELSGEIPTNTEKTKGGSVTVTVSRFE